MSGSLDDTLGIGETSMSEIGLFFTTIGTFVATIVAIAAALLWLFKRFNRIERRFDRTDNEIGLLNLSLAQLQSQSRSQFKVIVPLIAALVESETLDKKAAITMMGNLIPEEPMATELARFKSESNPLTKQELEKLKNYVNRARHGDILSESEATDFYNLADKLAAESRSEGAWLIFLLASFLFGLWLGSKQK